MNKITKLGVSALCGSLAAVSAANAGDLTVTGGVDMSWISLQDDTTGNPIGIGSNLTFAGSGELDNGWGVALSVALANGAGYSNTNVVVTVPGFGDVRIDQGTSGTGIDRYDDVTPNVWEEAYAVGAGSGIDGINGSAGGSTIELNPKDILPDGIEAMVAYSPKADGSNAADGATSGFSTSQMGSGYDVIVSATDAVHGIAGLTVYGGYSEINQDETNGNYNGDKEETTWAVKYALGSFTVGYQWSEEDLGLSAGAREYENEGYGITFQVNDDLSIGYNNYESKQTNTTSVTAEASSVQIAYSMGGATIRLAQGDVDNAAYQTAAMYDKEVTTLSVALAF